MSPPPTMNHARGSRAEDNDDDDSTFHRPPRKVESTGTLDLWRDGLLCAYEFLPSPSPTNLKVAADFVSNGQGHLDCEISVQKPAREFLGEFLGAQDAVGVPPSEARVPPGSIATAAAADGSSNLGTEVQGFVVRESLLKEGDQGQEKEEEKAAPPLPEHHDQEHHDRIKKRRKRSNHGGKKELGCQWVPIGWLRLSELFQALQSDPMWCDDDALSDEDGSLTAADLAHPYWQKRNGPTFWCHVDAHHPNIQKTLANSYWLHPAVGVALRDEKRLISDRMKHLLYEVPVRVAGGLLFELTGHSIGDPTRGEEDVPVVLRSWQAQNFLITSMHVKGVIHHMNVLGVMEVQVKLVWQDLVGAGGPEAPKCVQEVIAQLASHLSRWDDRMARKHYFGAADEVELKYVNRKAKEDLAVLSIILNREIRYLSTQVIRIKWSLHARQEIVHELMTHIKAPSALLVLDTVAKQTREMLDEQDAVRDRLFTVQDVMQSNARERLQQRSLRVQHNLSVIGGGGLLLSVIVGLFGINVDGIPGGSGQPHAFAIFTACLSLLGAAVIVIGILKLGLKNPPSEEELDSRKAELQDLVNKFKKAAEAHEKVNRSSTDSDSSSHGWDDPQHHPTPSNSADDYYVLLH